MESLKIKNLVKGIADLEIKGSREVVITGICANSKCVAPGNLFVAKQGLTQHGTVFIPDAIAGGAVAILTDIYDPFLENIVQLVHTDVLAMEEELAKRFYHHASDALLLVGITGTSGKTTTSYLVKHLLDRVGQPCGLIGSVEWIVGNHSLSPAHNTTPDMVTNQKLFYEMVQQGAKAAAIEVNSHALDQGRLRGIDFDIAVYTNLTQDHLDYHKTMEEYARVKSTLFTSLVREENPRKKKAEPWAIVNGDDPWHKKILADCRAKVLTYGIDQPVDLYARDIRLSAEGISCTVHYQNEKLPFKMGLIGRFNIYNCLAAIGVGLAHGLSLEQILPHLATFKSVRGRLERVPNKRGLSIFVDYAHKEDALKNVLITLKEISKGRIITLFGCGGNRDQGKRPKMGAVVEELSDVALITNDNPRNEDPEAIVAQILTGFREPSRALIELDRRAAIRRALEMACAEDVVLIAGKGHEPYQIFAHQTLPFDDAQVVREELVALNK